MVWLRAYPTYAILALFSLRQRVQRPGGSDDQDRNRQKPFYPGKRKAHPLRTQVAVSSDSVFLSVGKSVPELAHAQALLVASDLTHRIEKARGIMLDRNYDGIQTFDPKQPNKNGSPPYHLSHKAQRNYPLTDEQALNAYLSKHWSCSSILWCR